MKMANALKKGGIERYTIENESQSVSTDIVVSSPEEANRVAYFASLFSTGVITIKNVATDKALATYFHGKKVILIDAGAPINEDAAKKCGEFIWRTISSKCDDLNILRKKLKLTEPEKKSIKRLQEEITDILNRLEIALSKSPSSFEMLVFKYIDSKRYKHRTVERPEALNFNESYQRRLLAKGYVLTGEYACQHGWNFE